MDFLSTVEGSLLENFFPAGWDLKRIESCVGETAEETVARRSFWNPGFTPIECADIHDFNTFMGHEIAIQAKKSRDAGEQLILILPVGPMGMYRWAVYFLREWNVKCDHLYCFNMDEWSDAEGNTLAGDNRAAFRYAMEQAFYNPLGELTVPPSQRNFATRENLPLYAEKIAALRRGGARLALVFGVGRVCHIAFWEPHFAAEYETDKEWLAQSHRLGAKLHPLTVEQNAVTSFKSRTTLVPCRANTIGPSLIYSADYIIGGCDGALGREMQWQGLSFAMTLGYGPDRWVPSSFMPTIPGKLFYLKELAGPLTADCN